MKKTNPIPACIIALLAPLTANAESLWLVWDPSPATNNVTSYHVYASSNGAPFVTVGTVTTNSWRIGAPPIVPYRYRVAAVNAAGEGAPAEVAWTPPNPPPLPTDSVPGVVTGMRFIPSEIVSNGTFAAGFSGWNVSGSVEFWTNAIGAPSNHYLAFNTGNRPATGVASQQIPTLPGVRYTLNCAVGAYSPWRSSEQRLAVAVNGQTNLLNKVVSVMSPMTSAANVVPQSWTFVADGPVTLVFTDISAVTDSVDLVLDEVQVSYTP